MNLVLPAVLALHLSGLSLVGFPEEPPWQVRRPGWAIDATPEEQRQLARWLAWFYGFPDPSHRPAAPLPPRHRFTAVGPTIKIRVRGGIAEFDPYPSSVVQFTSLDALSDSLSRYRRQNLSIQIDKGIGEKTWVGVEGWIRPEFVTLATSRLVTSDSRRRTSTELWPGTRGDDERGAQFGVIPLDVDFRDGEHAPGKDSLRLAERSQGPWLFSLSSLPWGYELPSLGGTYRYLKLSRPISFEDDPVRARETLQGAQKEAIRAAKEHGIRVDLAFTGASSLCRVPFSIPTKYAWKTGVAQKLLCPRIEDGLVVDVAKLEELRELGREPATRRKLRAHEDRRRRHGEGVPGPLASHLEVRCKDVSYGRIYILRTCPVCSREGVTAHISEWDWHLTCKRATCAAADGMDHGQWLPKLSIETRKAIRAHIAEDEAWRHIIEYLPLRLEGPPTHRVQNHREGMLVIQRELESMHSSARRATEGEHRNSRMLLLGADCGAGKTLGAQQASHQIPIVYSPHQYTLLDAFYGDRPFQIQGMQKGCSIVGLGASATKRGVKRHYLCFPDKDPCPHLSKCPALPRIEYGKTPACVHAALATVSSGAVVENGFVLPKVERGKKIGLGRLLVIDEAPDFWAESTCSGGDVRDALGLDNFVDARSRPRTQRGSELWCSMVSETG